MPSSPESLTPAGAPSADLSRWCTRWNRRLHYFLGLYFLFFIWLFAFTGLVLNHSSWEFFRLERRAVATDRSIRVPESASPVDQARDVMRQLGLAGEIEWVATPADPTRLDFRLTTPASLVDLKVDLKQGRVAVQNAANNAAGTMQLLHTFTGVRRSDARNDRDWLLTSIWALSMDAVAGGLVVLVLGGLWMWLELTPKRVPGLIVLSSGLLICGWLVVGLKWIYG